MAISPYCGHGAPFAAALTLVPYGTKSVWLCVATPGAATRTISAQLLAIVVAHLQVPLLHPVLHPRREAPATAFLSQHGQVGDMRGPFMPTVVEELERIARALLDEHSALVADVAAALSGRRPMAFKSIPPGLPLRDPNNECSWAPPPPIIPIIPGSLKPYDDPEALFRLVSYDYEQERYLEGLTDDEVLERATEALVNAYNFDQRGRKVLIDLSDPLVVRALARLGEAADENVFRHGGDPKRWIEQLAPRWALPDNSGPLVERVREWIRSHRPGPVQGFVRYGRCEHLTSMLVLCTPFREAF